MALPSVLAKTKEQSMPLLADVVIHFWPYWPRRQTTCSSPITNYAGKGHSIPLYQIPRESQSRLLLKQMKRSRWNCWHGAADFSYKFSFIIPIQIWNGIAKRRQKFVAYKFKGGVHIFLKRNVILCKFKHLKHNYNKAIRMPLTWPIEILVH